jgi:hypothetical protein
MMNRSFTHFARVLSYAVFAFLLIVMSPAAAQGAGAETGVNPHYNKKHPAASVLLQNQPNPASDYTVIYFYLAQSGPVSLKLYSLSGKAIGYFIDGFQTSGWYSVGFNAGFLAKGEYIYRLTAPSLTSTLKMLVAK